MQVDGKQRRLNQSRVVLWTVVLTAVVSLALLFPIWRHQALLAEQARTASKPPLQAKIESGELVSPLNLKPEDFPYESISFERGPCYGDCPIYVVTFFATGKATLVSEQLRSDSRRTFVGEISPLKFARLCQLVDSAQKSTTKSWYAAPWTDDYTATIVAKSTAGTWRVSDYGQVAPVQTWVLEQMLDAYKESATWTPTDAK